MSIILTLTLCGGHPRLSKSEQGHQRTKLGVVLGDGAPPRADDDGRDVVPARGQWTFGERLEGGSRHRHGAGCGLVLNAKASPTGRPAMSRNITAAITGRTGSDAARGRLSSIASQSFLCLAHDGRA